MGKKSLKPTTVTYYDNMHPHYDRIQNPYRDPNNDIWEGRKPHHIDPDTGNKIYETWFGGATFTENDELMFADVKLNHRVSIFIIGNHLHIIDIRYDGVPMHYDYTVKDGNRLESSLYRVLPLEDERIDSMLRLKNIDCPVWEKVCKRARELWLEEIANRDKLRRYTPEFID